MISRVKKFIGRRFKDENGGLKQGDEYLDGEVGVILRWKDGRLNDDGEFPAVEFEDSHVEHFKEGRPHNGARDKNGKLKPAIIGVSGDIVEYYINGRQVKP